MLLSYVKITSIPPRNLLRDTPYAINMLFDGLRDTPYAINMLFDGLRDTPCMQ